MLPRLNAVQFERFMSTGRTSPALCGCEDPTGTYIGEYVVKLRAATGVPGLVNEVFAARLAAHFAIAAPEPALIFIEPVLAELAAATQPALASRVLGSAGLNFGTRALTGVSIWPVDKSVPEAMWEAAVNIFAFDALIQNPDRRYNNPNLFMRGDNFLIFDHETAFSFLLDLLSSPAPWKLEGQAYLADHVFYRRLKSKPIDLGPFTSSLEGLSDSALARIVADVPAEWNNESVAKIEQHLRVVRDRAEEFAKEVQRFLV